MSLRKAYVYDGILCIHESELFQSVYNDLKSVSKSKTKQQITEYDLNFFGGRESLVCIEKRLERNMLKF